MQHWWTDSTQDSKLSKVTIEEFRGLVANAPPHRDIREIILHHSWSPTVAQYNGDSTWQGIDRYHQETRGWSDIGYNIGIGPDQSIWLLRPLPRSGGHTLYHNAHSIGICMIGNFDRGHDDPADSLAAATHVVRALLVRYSLTLADVYFHRDFADKSCPGTGIDRQAFRDSLNVVAPVDKADLQDEPDTPSKPPVPIKVCAVMTGGVIAEYQMHPDGNHIADQGKVYVLPE